MTTVIAKDASITSLQVSIRALVVSNKQMTLAVFRQLPIARAIKDDGNLEDVAFWGRVLYPIKDEGDEWVIAEYAGILYRCPMPRLPKRPFREDERSSLERKLLISRNTLEGAHEYGESYVAKHAADVLEMERELAFMREDYDRWKNIEMPNTRTSIEKLSALLQLFVAV